MILPLLTSHFSLGTSPTLQASNIEKSTIDVKKETRGVMGATPEAKTFTAEEKNACSLEAMMNGETCEACQ